MVCDITVSITHALYCPIARRGLDRGAPLRHLDSTGTAPTMPELHLTQAFAQMDEEDQWRG